VRTDGDDECSITILLRSAILIASDALIMKIDLSVAVMSLFFLLEHCSHCICIFSQRIVQQVG